MIRDFMEVKFLDLAAQNLSIKNELDKNWEEVLASGSYVSGAKVTEFEDEFSNWVGTRYAVACNSGTSALELGLRAIGLEKGDEVIVPALTFIATVEAVIRAGGTPVIVDVSLPTYTLDPDAVRTVISARTKAILPVHLHGRVADMEKLQEIAEESNVILIEDAAQAHGSRRGIGKSGTYGLWGAFSFYPGKNLGALGEGGAIVTDDKLIRDKCRLMRNWGSKEKYVHEMRGTNFRMDELQAAILKTKLKHIDSWIQRRREIASQYLENVQNPFIFLPQVTKDEFHTYHVFAVRTNYRNLLMDHLNSKGVQTGIHYPIPVSLEKAYQSEMRVPVTCKGAEILALELLSIPIHESMDQKQVQFVISALNSFRLC